MLSSNFMMYFMTAHPVFGPNKLLFPPKFAETVHRKPEMVHQKPEMVHQKPETGHRKPGTIKRKPETDDRKTIRSAQKNN